MDANLFDFNLPEELIAQRRAIPFDSSKLLIIDRKDNYSLKHYIFRDIIDFLDENTVLVFNNTMVFRARLFVQKRTGAKVEILFLENPNDLNRNKFKALIRGKIHLGESIKIDEVCNIEVKEKNDYVYTIEIIGDRAGIYNKLQYPTPPYIHGDITDEYNTVYASAKSTNSVAAPTAGFHFTDELLERLRKKKVIFENITLNIGLGTFLPVKTTNIFDHDMHYEEYFIDKDVLIRLNKYKEEGKKIIAVGTTTTRTLEDSSFGSKGKLKKEYNNTNIFIFPGFKFNFVDGLITNFHLPKSTLIMLVSAFIGDTNKTLEIYRTAIEEKYRFYSFGDAMFILP